jgi:hypothetical protein
MITYRQFRSLVNTEVFNTCGLTLACLVDCDISDYWDDEYTEAEALDAARECAQMVLAENDFPL